MTYEILWIKVVSFAGHEIAFLWPSNIILDEYTDSSVPKIIVHELINNLWVKSCSKMNRGINCLNSLIAFELNAKFSDGSDFFMYLGIFPSFSQEDEYSEVFSYRFSLSRLLLCLLGSCKISLSSDAQNVVNWLVGFSQQYGFFLYYSELKWQYVYRYCPVVNKVLSSPFALR